MTTPQLAEADRLKAAADLLALINDAEADLAAWKALHASPGYLLAVGEWQKIKADLGLTELICNQFKMTPDGWVAFSRAVDQALALGDSIAAQTDTRVAFLDKLKAHQGILWAISKLIG